MYETFAHLKTEKKDAIIGAALEEFAVRGYDLSSTNSIVKNAGISKGALFHYFGDKRTLFLYLCGYAMDILEAEYFTPVSRLGGDLMVRLEEAVKLKLKLLSRYPKLFAFCARLLSETSPEVEKEMKRFQKEAMEQQHKALFEGLDATLLKEGIPPSYGFCMLWWILEGYSNELSARYQGMTPQEIDMEQAVKEFEAFTKTVRSIFYGKGGNEDECDRA